MNIAVDTGGTFTDVVYLEDGVLKARKVFSTPTDPSQAILNGIKGFTPTNLIHGTTVGTNAFLERKGARVAFITTSGFEDLVFIGRQARPKLYDFFVEKPAPILREDHTFGIKERISAEGKVLLPLSDGEIARCINWIKEISPEAIAVCLLHSYLYSFHEEKLKSALTEIGVPLSISSEVLPEFREYERASTTLINAYLVPVMSRYLSRLKEKLPGANLYIQQSNGGWLTVEEAKEFACHTVLSGPAGGAAGALLWASVLNEKRLITFDMGGTSTDVCLIDGELPFTREYVFDGYPLSIPVIDIHTVGAGGGSIAYIDRGGALKVGPQSAGADPGPACYGKALNPTVTDANVVLGRILPDMFLGGRYQLKKELSEEAIFSIGKKLGLSIEETALGIIKVANINMSRAVRKVSLERGYDPQEFVLFCFGGAGALHACAIAKELGIKKIMIPKLAGGFSAFGLLLSPPMKDFSLTVWLASHEKERLASHIETLRKKAFKHLKKVGLNPENFTEEIFLDLRYKGQGFELTVPFSEHFVEDFEEEHARHFGHSFSGKVPVEIVTLRLRLKGTPFAESFCIEKENSSFSNFETRVYTEEGYVSVPVVDWNSFSVGDTFEGPMLIIESFTTVWVEKGFKGQVKENYTLILERKD